ncbi:hypothetical protein B7494_g5584 [Chlorociboria aeruginascens]|nr:hypothetical protein B7494_g5584 [Chlorociboria aeruginascens]
MPPDLLPSDEEYASSEDPDFAPEALPLQASGSEASESESEAEPAPSVKKPKSTKRKRNKERPDQEAEDVGFENSGDEAIIEKGLKRKRKKRKNADEEDEGGEGGLVKTRSMRALEKVEKKPLADTSAATIDVDAVFAAMLAGKTTHKPTTPSNSDPTPVSNPQNPTIAIDTEMKDDPARTESPNGTRPSIQRSSFSDGPEAMVMIKRTYKFAGQIHTEQKLVPRNSAEAKLFLASQSQAFKPVDSSPRDPVEEIKPKRPLKKARRSIFEPIVEVGKRCDLHFGTREIGAGGRAKEEKAKKLNTVEKSAMDWAGFVDKEGIKDELDAAGKKKGAFRDRQEFLARVEWKKEGEERRARGL